jgi:SNF2 family DNA or RNA helicase
MTRAPYTPHPYQDILTEHILEHPRGNRFAGMGMGKTVAHLTAIDAMNVAEGTVPTLVLAPLRVAKSTWPREAQKWDHLRNIEVSPIVGTPAERLRAIRADANVWTINYDNLPWLVNEFADTRWPYRRIIADESTRLKNFRIKGGGVRAAALAQVAHQECDVWSNTTGTPAPNGLKDLWGPQWFVDRGRRLGKTYEAFKMRWFHMSHTGYGVDPTDFAQEQIQNEIKDCTVALDPRDWFDLEEPIKKDVWIDLPLHARAKYRELERMMFTELKELVTQQGRIVTALNSAALSMKCLQLASGTAWIDREHNLVSAVHDEKLEALESLLNEAGGMPVMVVYQWVPSKNAILKRFPAARFFDASAQTEDDWNAGRIPLLVIHPQSGGHGLNLQFGGNIICFYDQWWDLEQYDQVLERIGPVRQLQAGLNRNVWVYHLLARDTVDEDVRIRRESKREVQDILLDAMKRRSP